MSLGNWSLKNANNEEMYKEKKKRLTCNYGSGGSISRKDFINL